MNQKLQDELYKKYPKIFGQKDLDMTQTAMCWGIDCGDGWYNIIDTLCAHIQHEVDKPHEDIQRYIEYLEDPELPEATVTYFQQQIIESKKRIIPQVEATQVKEKYGGLRFYVFGGDDKIDSLISFAESMSDPPYIISHETGFKSVKEGVQRFAVETEFGEWDKPENFSMSDLEDSVKEYYRVLRDGGTAIVFCDLWKISHVKEMMEKHKFKQIRFIDWVKTNPVPLNSSRNYLTNAREVAILGVKRSKPTFNDKYHSGLYRYPICHDKGRFHSTQKPLQFMKDLVITHSNDGDVVLDTFAGAATTLLAAKELERTYLGCELDKSYYDKAVERLK